MGVDFGRIDDPSRHVVPELPEESALTAGVLSSSGRGPASLRIGLATWGDKYNVGTLYPFGTQPAEFLRHYASVYSTVELSATYYGLPEEERLSSWADAVGTEFRFLPKVSREITHRDMLGGSRESLSGFTQRMEALGDSCGPILLQLSPRFEPSPVNRDRLAAALDVFGIETAVELRHPSWFCPGADGTPPPAFAVLSKVGAPLVITDTVGAREVVHGIVTAPCLVLRFVACYTRKVDDARVVLWSRLIADWISRGLKEVYIYVHLDDPLPAHATASLFIERIAEAVRGVELRVHGVHPLPDSEAPFTEKDTISDSIDRSAAESAESDERQLPLF